MNTTATKVTKHTSWQEVVPFLRTGDIVTVHNQGAPARKAKVWVRDGTPLIMAGSYCIRYPDGTFHRNVTNVVLQSARGQADELEPLAASLKAGDVVRATYIFVASPSITLEGTVETDKDGDALLPVDGDDGDSPEPYCLTFYGRVAQGLRALEVIDH